MRYLAVVKVGGSFPETVVRLGDFEDWTVRGTGRTPPAVRVVDGLAPILPACAELAGVVVMGSHAMVSDREAWSERVAAWIRQLVAAEVPFLGICYGHQLLAHALGGEVGYHPAGPEIGTRAIELLPTAADDPLFADLPTSFFGHTTHSQTVLRLPPDTAVLARNGHEPQHVIRVGARAWGVQFHPEFDELVMLDYVEAQADHLRAHGQDPVAIRQAIRPTPVAAGVLRRFAALALGG